MTAHALLSASGAHRWMNCPGSVEATKDATRTTSVFAEEGTLAHRICELALSANMTCVDVLKASTIKAELARLNIDQAAAKVMAEHCQTYVDYVSALREKEVSSFFEVRVDFSPWVPDGFGTADAIIIKDRVMHICDLKFGAGVYVDVKMNPQLMLYALGAINDFGWAHEIDRIKMAVIQPRMDNISEWETTAEELGLWAQKTHLAAMRALEPGAPRIPGEKQCRWCEAKATCGALAKLTSDTLMSDFDNLEDGLTPANTLSVEQLGSALRNKALITAWLTAVEDHIKARIAEDGAFPGFKVVEGRSNRAWSDNVKAAMRLSVLMGESAYVRKLVSPAQAEKALGKANKAAVADLITKPPGAPTLVSEDDPRPSVHVNISDFQSFSGEEE